MGEKICICGLCKNERELKKSHIMPKFVFSSLKRTTITGHIREVSQPNKRVQDGSKIDFLCDVCEEKFSALEWTFAEKIYQPIIENEETFYYEYHGDWLKRFLVSIAWRSLWLSFYEDNFDGYEEHELDAIKRKLEEWRLYLNGEVAVCSDMVRLFPLTKKYRDANIYPGEIQANYFMRTVELHKEIMKDGSWAFTYLKMPYLLASVDFILKGEPIMSGFEISEDSGVLFGNCIEIPKLIGEVMLSNYNRIIEAVKSQSNEQTIKILKDAKKNWINFEKSETWKSLRERGVTKEQIENMMKQFGI